jgi:hypothetical protein
MHNLAHNGFCILGDCDKLECSWPHLLCWQWGPSQVPEAPSRHNAQVRLAGLLRAQARQHAAHQQPLQRQPVVADLQDTTAAGAAPTERQT